MKGSRRLRFGMWLERFTWMHSWLFETDATFDDGSRRCVNRVNGHLVMISSDGATS